MEPLLEGARLYHVGIAVRSIEDAIGQLAGMGMAATPVFELDVPSMYRGAETRAGVKAAFIQSGPIAIELVQPAGGKSPIATFLEERGEGVQHFGYYVPDLEAALGRAEALGIEADWLVSDEHGPAVAYLSPGALFGVSIELVREEPRLDIQALTRR